MDDNRENDTMHGRRPRVLIVDDHPLFRAGVRQRLGEMSAVLEVIGEAGDGREAVDIVGRSDPDVVLMDLAMPGLNGIEATRLIKSGHPRTAVLILTAYDDDEYVAAILAAGAAGYLLKTVQVDDLARGIVDVFNGEEVLDPAVSSVAMGRFARPGEAAAVESGLSVREMEILRIAAGGASNKQIATDLHVSIRTVHAHMSHILAKLSVGSRTEAVVCGLRNGWLSLKDLPGEGAHRSDR